MYIEPNSLIKIMKNVPLDNTYSHTIYFDTITEQASYFSSPSVVKYSLTAQSYQRVVKGKMRIEISADNLYDCNYLAFQNTNFGNKWFYAFITNVEYVNNSTAEIQFEIDVMQTYHFDYEIKDCFVEREHAMDDTIGANTLKEPVEVGGADVYDNTDYYFTDWSVVIAVTPSGLTSALSFISRILVDFDTWLLNAIQAIDESVLFANVIKGFYSFFLNLHRKIIQIIANFLEIPDDHKQPYVINHTFTGSTFFVRHIGFNEQADGQDIADFIRNYLVPMGYKISNVYMCPTEFIGASLSQPIKIELDDAYTTPASQFAYMSKDALYTPKNNKLRTAPYTYFRVTNNQGTKLDLAYERMATNNKYFDLYTNWVGGVEAMIQMPKYGRESSHEDRSTQISLTNFPLCSWNEGGLGSVLRDTIKNSMAGIKAVLGNTEYEDVTPQNNSNISSFQMDAERAQANVDRPKSDFDNIVGAISTANTNIGTTSSLNGTMSSSTDVGHNRLGFCFYGMAITGEQAEVIDNFFEHYGYATMLNKVPNRNGRPHWNFVKTRDCYIVANAPSESVRKICSIYDNGITFWKNPSEVGNYNLNNH